MNFITDLINIIINGLSKLSPQNLLLTFGLGTIVSILFYFVCNYYCVLWNKSFKTTYTHKILSIVASILTFFFILSFVAFSFFDEATKIVIVKWKIELNNDELWGQKTFTRAYEAVKDCCSNLEDFTKAPHPNTGVKTEIPLSNIKSQEVWATIRAEQTCEHFNNNHPFLAKLILTKSESTINILKNDVLQYFQKVSRSYPSERAIEKAGEQISKELMEQTPRVVKMSRVILIALFLIVQSIPFGLIGFAAYRNLKIRT